MIRRKQIKNLSASTGLPDNNMQGGVWIMNAGTTTAHIMTPGEGVNSCKWMDGCKKP